MLTGMTVDTRPARVLVVDDDETFRKSTADLLRVRGYACDCAGDGAAAEAMLDRETYDLIVADILMPGNSNLEFVATAYARDSDTCTLLVTAYPSLETALASMRYDVAGYLVKPLDVEEFLALVARGAERTGARRLFRQTGQRLHDHAEQLNTLRLLEGAEGNAGRISPTQAFLDLTIANIAGSLQDLLRLAGNNRDGARRDADPDHPGCSLFNCPTERMLRETIADAIRVLHRTKQSFRSKELGELRCRLEQALGSGPV